MSPESNKDQILPEEPYAQHYQELENSPQVTTVEPEKDDKSTETKKGFINMKKLLAMGGLALALPAGIYAHKQYENETRFPDSYHNVEKQEPIAVASNAVDIEAAHQAAVEPIASKETVPWVTVQNSINAQIENEK